MIRQCEFKKRYDPNLDMYATKHIYGEGISDVFKEVGRKIFGRTAKKVAESAAKKAATKTGEKGGYKIVDLLRKNKTKTPSVMMQPSSSKPKELTTQEVNERVNQILSGGKLRRRNFI